MAGLSSDTDFFLTPPRQHLATIQFALGENREQLRNYRVESTATLYGQRDTATIHIVNWEEADVAITQRVQSYGSIRPFLNAQWVAVKLASDYEFEESGRVGSVRISADVTLNQSTITTMLRWQPIEPLLANLTAFVHILDADGNIIAQTDREPAGYPTSDWLPDELIQDRFSVPLADNLCAGCRIVTGFYGAATGLRLGRATRHYFSN